MHATSVRLLVGGLYQDTKEASRTTAFTYTTKAVARKYSTVQFVYDECCRLKPYARTEVRCWTRVMHVFGVCGEGKFDDVLRNLVRRLVWSCTAHLLRLRVVGVGAL